MISFVIPQKGRLDLLEATLLSIGGQDLRRASEFDEISIEVVLITQDDEPQAVRDLLKRLFEESEFIDYKCMVADNEDSTIACLRNRAARASSYELIAFLDADISLSSNWAVAMSYELVAHDARALVSAMQVLGPNPSKIEYIQVELNHLHVDSTVGALSGHNLLVSRETFELVGGFPEHLVTCEDSVFTDKVGKLGQIYRSSEASYVHLGEDRNFTEVFSKEKWRSYSNLATLYGREVRSVELISFVAPLVVVASLLVAFVATLAGKGFLVLAFTGIAMIPVILYSARLLLKASGQLDFLNVFVYYLIYFVARGIGMIGGLSSALRVRGKLKETS